MEKYYYGFCGQILETPNFYLLTKEEASEEQYYLENLIGPFDNFSKCKEKAIQDMLDDKSMIAANIKHLRSSKKDDLIYKHRKTDFIIK